MFAKSMLSKNSAVACAVECCTLHLACHGWMQGNIGHSGEVGPIGLPGTKVVTNIQPNLVFYVKMDVNLH